MDSQAGSKNFTDKSSQSSPASPNTLLDEDSDLGEDYNDASAGTPLGARISYHAGLNLDEKEAFKLCFPGFNGKDLDDEVATAGSGDTINLLISKMRRSMGSVDLNSSSEFDISSMSEDEDSFVELTPVHKTESLLDLAKDEGKAKYLRERQQELQQEQQMITESSHHIGDAGTDRPSANLMVDVAKADIDPHITVFAEGHSSEINH